MVNKEDEDKSFINLKELALILISAILGAFLSLHLFVIYLNNNEQIPPTSMKLIGVLFALSIPYLAYTVGFIIIIAIIMVFFGKYSDLTNESSERFINFLLSKLNLKRKKKRKKLIKLSKNKIKESKNIAFLSFCLALLIYYSQILSKYIKGIYFFIVITTIAVMIDRIRLFRN